MSGLTLLQRYYAMNAALDKYLSDQQTNCPVIKYGIDPATLKTTFKDTRDSVFPYIQTHISNVRPVAWTSLDSGIMTEFDYQLSFFTSPADETVNDAAYFIPFEVARIGLTDVNRKVLSTFDTDGNEYTIANILDLKFHYEFEMKTGSPVPAAFLIARMRAVCAYVAEAGIVNPTESTDLFSGIQLNGDNL